MSATATPLTLTQREKLAVLRRRQTRELVGHELVALGLKRLGITHVLGVSGNPVDGTMAACAAAGLRVIGMRHQHGAVLAAAAYNYSMGGLHCAAIVSAGPAVTQCATGVLVARDNHWPLLLLGGRRAQALRGRAGFQDFDGQRFFEPLVKSAALAARSGDLQPILRAGCETAQHGEPGPVYIDLAEEALEGMAMPLPADDATPCASSGRTMHETVALDDAALDDGARAFLKSQRPALLIGDGLRWAQAWSELLGLVDEFSCPFAATPLAHGFLSERHPLCLSAARGALVERADLVLVAGTRLDWTLRFGVEIARGAQLFFVGPAAEDAAQAHGRGRALRGDARQVLAGLLQRLRVLQAAGQSSARDAKWLAHAQQTQRTRRAALQGGEAAADQPPSPFEWMRELAAALPADCLTVLDGNVVMSAAQLLLQATLPVSRLTPGNNGCMGTGIPFGIGMRLAHPDRPVVVICGDFAFGQTMMELETAVRHRTHIIVIVANNGGPGGSTRQAAYYPGSGSEPVCLYTPGVRHDLMVAAMGGLGLRVQRRGELAAALHRALQHDGPSCIDMVTCETTDLVALV